MAPPLQAIRNGVGTARAFVQEAWAETKKVIWPTQKEVRSATVVVLVLVAFVALFLFSVDALLSWLLSTVLGS